MTKLNGKSLNIKEQNIEKLKEIFPEIVSDGAIDFDKLKQLLGDYVDDSEERYRFVWNGKGEALRLSQTPSMGTLRPAKEDSKDWDNTENLFIEGDNLEVLKLLQKSYFGKIKMIYIDPPYNTGKDFVYSDDYRDNIKNYKKITGQVDENNRTTTTNPEYSGRYHTDWLNMMYPRLRLARNLLSDDGVIFISIDDNEVHNLRKICDEVFGEDNFVGEIIRKTKSMVGDDGNGINHQHEKLIMYGLEKSKVVFRGEEKEFDAYSNPDDDPRGDWCLADPSAKSGGDTTYYGILNPYTSRIDYPPEGRYWAFNKDSMERYIVEGRIKFKKQHTGNERGFIFKRYKSNLEDLFNPVPSLFAIKNLYMNQAGTKDLRDLGLNTVFNYPKPTDYLKTILKYFSFQDPDSIILDFFAGSATTAHAVMDLNAEDGGNRKYIMVQLPEPTDEKSEAYKAGFENIAEIGKERIRRAGDKIKEELEEKYNSASDDERENIKNPEDLDIGFKVFKLDSSNIKEWNPGKYGDIQTAIEDSLNPYVDGRTEEDVVYEMMLKMGIDLTYPIEEHTVDGKTIYSIGFGSLMICLAKNIDVIVARKMVELKEESQPEIWRVIFRDAGFNSDQDKTNVKETLKSAGLLDESFVTL